MAAPGTGTPCLVHVLHHIIKLNCADRGSFSSSFLLVIYEMHVATSGTGTLCRVHVLHHIKQIQLRRQGFFFFVFFFLSYTNCTWPRQEPVPRTGYTSFTILKKSYCAERGSSFSSLIKTTRGHARNRYPVPGTHPSPLKKFYSAGRGCSTSSSHIQTIRGHSRIPYPVPGTPPSPY